MQLGSTDKNSFGKSHELEFFLFDLFEHRDEIESQDFKARFDAAYSGRNREGLLFFFSRIELISTSSKKIKKINFKNWPSRRNWQKKILLITLKNLYENKELEEMFYRDLLKIEGKRIAIDPSRIAQKFIPIRNLFFELHFLEKKEKTKFVYFNQFLQKEIFKYTSLPKPYIRKKISQKDLEARLLAQSERNNKNGEVAEKWVLAYEKKKFKGKVDKSLFKTIERISQKEATLGYDIVSLQSEESALPDKFIEVKSYAKEQRFFWSKNEMRVAREKKNNYFLYLVDRRNLEDLNYQPKEIKNPAKKILNGKVLEEELKFHNEAEGFIIKPDSFIFNF